MPQVLQVTSRVTLAILCFATTCAAGDDMTGTWRHAYKGQEGATFTEVTLRQTGKSVVGYSVEDGSGRPGIRRWEACRKGRSDGARATVRTCYTNQGGLGTTIPACPEYGALEDQFVLVDGKLMWFHRNEANWVHYQTLAPVAKPMQANLSECQ